MIKSPTRPLFVGYLHNDGVGDDHVIPGYNW